MEAVLHLYNPWILAASVVMFLVSIMVSGLSLGTSAIILLTVALVLAKPSRETFLTWVLEQLILIYASISSLFSMELTWQKVEEIRGQSTRDLI